MTERRQNEWADLESKALELLAYCSQPEGYKRPASAVLRLWNYPSFGVYTSWVVYRISPAGEELEYIVEEKVWDRPSDAQRMFDPLVGSQHPLKFSVSTTISTRSTVLLKSKVVQMLEELSSLRFRPFCDDGSFGLDGETFGVETFGFQKTLIEWRCDGPAELQELARWAQKARSQLAG